MRCPYHDRPVEFVVPERKLRAASWWGWLDDCCGLPAWRCGKGDLHPVEAKRCPLHNCSRPGDEMVNHEVARKNAEDAVSAVVRAPAVVYRELPSPALEDSRCSPCFAGDLVVYLAETGALVLVRIGGGGRSHAVLLEGVSRAHLTLEGGAVAARLDVEGQGQQLLWGVRKLRRALRSEHTLPEPQRGTVDVGWELPAVGQSLRVAQDGLALMVDATPLRGLEGGWTPRRHAELKGRPPGRYHLSVAPANDVPPVGGFGIRPARLHQVPVPLPGGFGFLGAHDVKGAERKGVFFVPSVRRSDAGD